MSAGCSKEHNRPSAAVRRLRRSLPRWPPICSRHNVVDRHGSCICCGLPRQDDRGRFRARGLTWTGHQDEIGISRRRAQGTAHSTKRFQHVYRVFSGALCLGCSTSALVRTLKRQKVG